MQKLSLKNYQLFGSIGLILACLAGIIGIQQGNISYPTGNFKRSEYLAQEGAEKLQLDVIKKLPAVGFDNLLADWLYLRYIQYFGDSDARDLIGYPLASDYMEAIVSRDPFFVDALIKLDTGTSIFGGDPHTSVASLEKSLAVIPSDLKANEFPPYWLWVTKGINELLFLGDTKAAQQSYKMAAQWAEQYDSPETQRRARQLRRTAQFIEKRPDSKIPQIGAWTMVLSSTSDERTIKRALMEIRALGGEIVEQPNGAVTVRVPEWVK